MEQQHMIDVATIVYLSMMVTVQDTVNLLANDKACIPQDWTQTKVTLNNYLTLFHGLIGHTHPLVLEMH